MTNTTPQAAEAARLAEEAKLRADAYMAASSFRGGDAICTAERDKMHAAIDRLRDLASRAGSPVGKAAGLPMKMVIDPTIPAGEARVMQDGKRVATITGLAVDAKPTAAEVTGEAKIIAWRPAVKCTPEMGFNAGEPRKADVDYWQSVGAGIEYAYDRPSASHSEAQKAVAKVEGGVLVSRSLHRDVRYWRAMPCLRRGRRPF